MTTRQHNILRKGDIIINPKTQRPVKVGSRTWLKLVKDGLVEGSYSDPTELYEVQDKATVEAKIEELNKALPNNVQAVRGRGRYANKIVKRRKQPTTRELTQHTARTAARAVSENIETLTDCYDLESQLENLIMNEILGTTQPQARPPTAPIAIPKQGRGRPKKEQVQEQVYETYEAPIYDYQDNNTDNYRDNNTANEDYEDYTTEYEEPEEKEFYED
jgi:hypothetical protein